MAREKIKPFWEVKIRELKMAEPHIGATAIASRLETLAGEMRRSDYPSERSVGRVLNKLREMTPDERAAYGAFSWPASMENELLPWEASRVALDVLRAHRLRGWPPPTVTRVLWHWRVSLASPSSDMDLRESIVLNILAAEESGGISAPRLSDLLAFEPWRNELCRSLYNQTFPEHPWTEVDDAASK